MQILDQSLCVGLRFGAKGESQAMLMLPVHDWPILSSKEAAGAPSHPASCCAWHWAPPTGR